MMMYVSLSAASNFSLFKHYTIYIFNSTHCLSVTQVSLLLLATDADGCVSPAFNSFSRPLDRDADASLHPSIHPLCSLHLVWLMACGHACCHVLQVIRGSCSSVPWKLILFPYLLHSRYKTNPCRQQQCWVKLEMLCQRESKSKSKNGEVMLCGWWCREGTGGQGKSTPSVPKCRTFFDVYLYFAFYSLNWMAFSSIAIPLFYHKKWPRVNLHRPNHACYTTIDNRSTQIGKTKQPATNFSIIFASK